MKVKPGGRIKDLSFTDEGLVQEEQLLNSKITDVLTAIF